MSSAVAGDLLAFFTIAAILVAFGVTTWLVIRRSVEAMRRRGWSQLATTLAVFGLVNLMGLGGWLLVDIWWALKAVVRKLAPVGSFSR